MNVAIIPARGGSKRIPKKNIKDFSGKPMLHYAIDVAQNSELFDEIFVTSDDSEILTLARALGVSTIKRADTLADDITPTLPVVADAVRKLDKVDFVCCIYPCVPLLEPRYIKEGFTELNSQQEGFVFPVIEFRSSIQRAFRIGANHRIEPFYPEYSDKRTQDLEPAYYDAGQFYWATKKTWLEEESIHQNGRGIIISNSSAVDIDTVEDWKWAELMFKAKQVSSFDL